MISLTKMCDICGTAFQTRSKNAQAERFCSKRCRQKWSNQVQWAKHRPEMPPKRLCEVCSKEFQPNIHTPQQKACSIRCGWKIQDAKGKEKRAARRDLSPKTCKGCGKPFTPHLQAWAIQEYCSPQCNKAIWARQWRASHPGKDKERQQRRRCNGNWLLALERSGHQCELCGIARGLNVHHRDGSGETASPNHALDNLMVLCEKCHRQLHEINYRVIDGTVYVTGKIFELLGVETVQVLRE